MTPANHPAPRPATPGTRPRKPPILLLNAQYLPSSRDWRTAAGRADTPFRVETFVREAQQAEAAGIDALFQADFSGVNRAGLRSGPPLTVFEPFQAAALIASATSRIAVMPTVSTLYTHPFSAARSLASLDRISGGRAWVNLVSSFRSGTAIGIDRDVPRDRRHAQTEEFLHVTRRLWASWPPAANEPDPVTGRFVRDDLISDVDHAGEFYTQSGPIDMPPYSAAFPFTLQATASLAGLQLAARTADGVFAGTPTLGAARALRRVLRRETRAAGRPEDSVALLPGSFIQLVGSRAEAEALRRAQRAGAAARGGRPALDQLRARFPRLALGDAHPADRLPADLLPRDPDEVFASYGSGYLPLWDLAREPGRTVGELAVEVALLGEHARFLGTPEQLGDELRRWYDEDGVDGFQFILGNDFDALRTQVVPRLRGVPGPDQPHHHHPPSRTGTRT
ncbi:LLM class flavin-dependent oxidoreductase [Streptomyces sp. DSM 44915]|uniref:LLM class flavin-dependent oxidoreductase n=1 Tax=Streptomyces chisholmiae TaxID=3075540 RepID=A0ABU2JUB8_9ACTN|nr:LLM class flavin-dependent oxidoreductase [Streptomyces sp. DSM 44915]MDT0268550.1 LLM class flavin-dependent oxidoreductase [Streptomyces sp. DSM 44915]